MMFDSSAQERSPERSAARQDLLPDRSVYRQETFRRDDVRPLAADAGWLVDKEVARATRCVVRIGDLRRRRSAVGTASVGTAAAAAVRAIVVRLTAASNRGEKHERQ